MKLLSKLDGRGFGLTYTIFTLRRLLKGALGMGLVYGITILSQAVGIVRAYPDMLSRMSVMMTFKKSTGLQILYGSTEKLDGGVATYITWRIMGILIVVAAIWAIVVTTRLMRGDEEAGRQELVLAKSPSSLKIFQIHAICLLWVVVIQIGITTIITLLSNKAEGVSLSVGDSILLSVTIMSGALMFIGIASLGSQLYQSRRKASLVTSGALAIMFLIRAAVSVNKNVSFLKYISPLSWLDSVEPLTSKKYLWFIPVFLVTFICMVLAAYLAHKRDMGEGVIVEDTIVRKKSRLTKNSYGSSLLFTRGLMAVWAVSVVSVAGFISSLSSTAADAIGDSSKFQSTISNIVGSSTHTAVKLFLGLVFFVVLLLLMIAVAQLISGLRAEEASGELDNIVVRGSSRIRWIIERISLVVTWILIVSFAVGIVSWIMSPKSAEVTVATLIGAGINMVFPALLIASIGVLVYGFRPQLTAAAMYGVIGWSFLVEIIVPLFWPDSTLLNVSLFHHIALAPAADVDWTKSWVILSVACVLTFIGITRFLRRDLQG